jgi:hypothetical protein
MRVSNPNDFAIGCFEFTKLVSRAARSSTSFVISERRASYSVASPGVMPRNVAVSTAYLLAGKVRGPLWLTAV